MFKFYKNEKQILAYDDILDEMGEYVAPHHRKTNIIVDTTDHINPHIGICSITNHSKFLLEVGGVRSEIFEPHTLLSEDYFNIPFHAYSQFNRVFPVWVGWNARNSMQNPPEIQISSAGYDSLIESYYSLMPLQIGQNEVSILHDLTHYDLSGNTYNYKVDEVFYLVCAWGEELKEYWQIPFRNKKNIASKIQVLKRINNA